MFDAIMQAQEPFIRSADRLSVACGSLSRRSVGDAWVWDRKGVGDISPFYAITLARAAALKHKPAPIFAY
jgi:hypothetical protein